MCPMSTKVPESVAQRVLGFPEWRVGAHRVGVVLAEDRRTLTFTLPGPRVVRVGGYEVIPFETAQAVEVVDLSDSA
jgi:hypothetical protein